MPKSRHRKKHKQKVKARNIRVQSQKNRIQKMQREFIMDLIKKEQEKGMFENNPTINANPMIDGPMIDGPVIDAPILNSENSDGVVVEGPSI